MTSRSRLLAEFTHKKSMAAGIRMVLKALGNPSWMPARAPGSSAVKIVFRYRGRKCYIHADNEDLVAFPHIERSGSQDCPIWVTHWPRVKVHRMDLLAMVLQRDGNL